MRGKLPFCRAKMNVCEAPQVIMMMQIACPWFELASE